MELMTIASGSSGNCTLIGSQNTHILVDVGISKKKINENLHDVGLDFTDVNGIIITHEHIDHIRGLGIVARSCGIPIYGTGDTLEAISNMDKLGSIDHSLFHSIDVDEPFMIGDLTVEAHGIWHDAVDPVCYTVKSNEKKISIATDLGDYDEYLVHCLKDSDAMVIEANHDIRMLQVGRYPYQTKQRILSSMGHLSNEAGGRFIRSLLNDHIKGIYLGHLSKENNMPELAYCAVENELLGNPYTEDVRDFNLQVARRNEHNPLLQF